MYIKKENIEKVLDITFENCGKYNIHNSFDPMMMTLYNSRLDQIAKKNNYQEGKKISENDLVEIKKTVNNIISGMAMELKKEKNILNKDSKMYFSGFDTLMAANDYLFTLAMKKLGCPDMPTSFGLDVCTNIQNTAKELDETIKQSYYNEEYSTKTYFDNQRKKDADDVRFKNKSLISTFKSSLGGTADQLAELVAEYQALKLRQDGHGPIWRFFHRTQNKERMELLEDMKSAITNAVGDNVNLDPKEKTPADIAALLNNKLIDKKGIEAFKPESFAKRSNSMDSIIYDPILKEGSISNQEKNKPNVNISENEKRVAVDFKGKEFIENNGEGLSPVVSNDSAIKNNKNLEK